MLLPKRGETAGTALASCDAFFSFLAVLSLVLYGHVRISFLLAGDSIRQRNPTILDGDRWLAQHIPLPGARVFTNDSSA
jgi:hypothetical protein